MTDLELLERITDLYYETRAIGEQLDELRSELEARLPEVAEMREMRRKEAEERGIATIRIERDAEGNFVFVPIHADGDQPPGQ